METSQEQKGKTVILWDIENFLYPALKDTLLGSYSGSTIMLAIAAVLEDIALSYGEVKRRLGALSLPPETAYRRNPRIKEERTMMLDTIQEYIVTLGYPIMLVPHGRDAADKAIVEIGLGLVRRNHARTCILATGDGRGPLYALAEKLIRIGKHVHVASYNYIPASIKRADITHSVIAGDVRMILETTHAWWQKEHLCSTQNLPQSVPDQTTREMDTQQNPMPQEKSKSEPDTITPAEIITPAPSISMAVQPETHRSQPTIRESVRTFLKNRQSPNLDPVHCSWICSAVCTILLSPELSAAKSGGNGKATNFARIKGIIERSISEWPTPSKPGREDLDELVGALVTLSDLFEVAQRYVFNPASKLREWNIIAEGIKQKAQ